MPKPIPNRFFWTWDHSTNWCLHAYGAQNSGVANVYAKAPEMFEADYKRLVDFCAEHKFNAVGIVGMLRDKHGGVESARRLCDYANNKGVKIYMIAGLYAYGGIYYEGNHKYSLNRFFGEHPECIGKRIDGTPLIVQFKGKHGYNAEPQGCASDERLHEYILESLDWLFRDIPELGGIQMESGDSGVCQCERCRARRGEEKSHISVADMAGIYPEAADVIYSRNPDALVICETYHHFTDEACRYFETEIPDENLRKLFAMPEKVFWQWKCDAMLRDNTWSEDDRMLPSMRKFNHVMRAHSGTQWWGGRAVMEIDKLRRQCRLSHTSGINGVSMFGECASFHTGSEFNYLALEYFSDDPYASNEDYIADVMAPRLGGKAIAEEYFEYAQYTNTPEKIPQASKRIAKITASIENYDHLRRWQYLASFLNGYYWEHSQQNPEITKTKDSDRIGDNNQTITESKKAKQQ